MNRRIVVAAALFAATSTAALAQGIPSIEGRWSEDRTGEQIVIVPSRFGWETWTTWGGQTTITSSGGYRGSHVKMEGMDSRCFYVISVNEDGARARKMTLGLREGNPRCPQSGVWSGVLR